MMHCTIFIKKSDFWVFVANKKKCTQGSKKLKIFKPALLLCLMLQHKKLMLFEPFLNYFEKWLNYYFSYMLYMSRNNCNKMHLSNTQSLGNNASCYQKVQQCNRPLFSITNNSKQLLKIKITSITPFVIPQQFYILYLQNKNLKTRLNSLI